jgi:hypothetical protein
MATKRTSPATSPATKRSLPVQEIPPATPVPAPAPSHDPAELSRTHELIVDAVTTMLSTGGHPADVDSLLRAAMAHTRRRTLEHCGVHDQAEAAREASKFIGEEYQEWKHDLVAAWRKNRRKEPGAFEPETITDRIRFNVRDTLTDQFEEFMGEASPEEQRFLSEVFLGWDSSHLSAECKRDELFLGNAFEFELGRNGCYIRVPKQMLDRVQKYVDALRAVEDKEVA